MAAQPAPTVTDGEAVAGSASKTCCGRKICVFTANRADYSKLRPLMRGIEDDSDLQLSVVIMGSHLLDDFGSTYKAVEADEWDVAAKLHTLVAGGDRMSMVESVGLALTKIPDVLDRVKPDVVVVHGDRFDAMAVAVAASFMNIFVAHLEGGEVTGTIDESIRHAVTKLSHLHFVCTEDARRRVVSMGEPHKCVVHTGCPALDVIHKLDHSRTEEVLRSYGDRHPKSSMAMHRYGYFIVSYHPVTSDIEGAIRDYELIIKVLLEMKVPTIFLFPNVDAGSKEMVRVGRLAGLESTSYILCMKHIPFDDYMLLLAAARCLVGNSSAGIREAGALGTPSINIGTRQSNRTHGPSVLDMKEPTFAGVMQALNDHGTKRFPADFHYGTGKAVKAMLAYLKEADISATQKQYQENVDLSQIDSPLLLSQLSAQ